MTMKLWQVSEVLPFFCPHLHGKLHSHTRRQPDAAKKVFDAHV